MKAFSELFKEEYNTQQDQWENALKAELKIEEVSGKIIKKHLDLGSWPTLSASASDPRPLASTTQWKKASQTYLLVDELIDSKLKDDLHHGVRVFFFHQEFLLPAHWQIIVRTLESFEDAHELEIYLLGKSDHKFSSRLKLVSQEQMLLAEEVSQQGGHNVHELALLTTKLIEGLDNPPTHMGIYLDSHFFKNIAKLRAAKLLVQKVLQESGLQTEIKFIALNSYREWTLFERYSNMLRNNVQVASALIGGADVVQSSGYQVLFELEADVKESEHQERSLRMSRNTAHILSLESMLGIVEDAAYGSFHLENLSHQYAEAAWKLMRLLVKQNVSERDQFLQAEVGKVRAERLQRVNLRKDVLAGMNDFPDGREHLGISLKSSGTFRVARGFEELRLKVEPLQHKPKVFIALEGDYGGLNNRVNFIKNFFELIGLEVIDPVHSQENPANKILVLCAKDEDYPEVAKKYQHEKAVAKYVAGKVEVSGYESIFAGQNVYQALCSLVEKLEVVK